MTAKIKEFSVSLLGKELKPVKSARVILDSNLTFNEHVVQTVSAFISRLGQINRIKHAFDKRTLIIIINAVVFSKLFYCSNVWSNTSQANLDKLQSEQNFACRTVTGSRKYDRITPQSKKLGWLLVRQQLCLRFATLAFKCMNGCAPE